MSHALTPRQIHDRLSELGETVASVYLPRPAVQTGGEKLRIATKTAAQAVEARAPYAEALIEALGALEQTDIQSPGLAMFQPEGGDVKTVRMNTPPNAMVHAGGPALWLPVVADAAMLNSAWVAAMDRDAPRLYKFAAGELHDFSAIVDLPDFGYISARREPQTDALFHSASHAGATAGHGGFAKFHALGTSEDEEAEKTDEVFNREAAIALEEGLPPTTQCVYLAGDPRRIGHIAAHLEGARFEIVLVEAAGEALAPDRLKANISERAAAAGELKALAELSEAGPDKRIALDEMERAGRMNMVDTLWIGEAAAGLRQYDEDETFHFDDETRPDAVASLQDRLAEAIRTASAVRVLPGIAEYDGVPAIGTARYELTGQA